MKLRRFFCTVTAVLLIVSGIGCAKAADTDTVEGCAQKLLNFYRCYQLEAREEIDSLLKRMEKVDPAQAKTWQGIMDTWEYVDSELELCYNVLPDGLPEDDSLGIVIMGFGLNADGTIRQELYRRLEVGLASARKYPNAYIIVTGGPTAFYTASTEAGMMKLWLLEQGIPVGRIISEPRSLSTAENALFVHRILAEKYPDIRSIAVITSDYHIYRSYLDFAVISLCRPDEDGKPAWEMVGHACSDPGYERSEDLSSHAADIAFLAGIELQYQRSTELYSGK